MSEAAKPYTLEDLKNWPPQGLDWSAAHVGLAVIGHPIAHSLSPVMHNAALAVLAKTNPEFSKWRYFKFDIEPKDLAAAIGIFAAKSFRGLNLTVPHKTEVLEHVSHKSAAVEDAKAANTLKFQNGQWHGYSTDGYGLNQALIDHRVSMTDATVLLLGAGGAARSAALEALMRGCRSVRIHNRTKSAAQTLIDDLSKSSSYSSATELSLYSLGDELPAGAIVINATSLGLKVDDPSPLDLSKIPRPAFVFDMIYRPAQTRLLKQAAEMGIPQANGLSMLVHQGADSLAIWTKEIRPEGKTIPVHVMDDAVRSALAQHTQ